jgi:hypothetical protein
MEVKRMKEKIVMLLMGLSILTAAAAGYVFVTQNSLFGIAGTQWILISILLGVYANHAVHCPMLQGGSCCGNSEVK